MKAVGALLLIGAIAALGNCAALERERRVRELGALLHGLHLLETEVVFGRTLLPEALRRVGRSHPECGLLFNRAAVQVDEGRGASRAWLAGVEAWRRVSALNTEDIRPLRKLSSVLGRSAADDQERHLRLVRTEVAGRLDEARQRLPQVSRLCRVLGVCGGLAIALLLY